MKASELAKDVVRDGKVDLRNYHAYLLTQVEDRKDLDICSHPLNYHSGRHQLLEITSKEFGFYKAALVWTAGFHGNEPHAFLGSAVKLNEVVNYAHKNRVGVRAYLLVNESGARQGTRYNADTPVEDPVANNDFVRYFLTDGRIVDDLGGEDENKVASWWWAADSEQKLPEETRLLSNILTKNWWEGDFRGRIKAVVDCHVDRRTQEDTDVDCPASYQYIFGDPNRFNSILDNVAGVVPLWTNKKILSGLATPAWTDGRGNVTDRYDGTVTDLTRLLGVKDSVAVEVSADTDLDTAAEVYGIWVRGMVDLIVGRR
ncbi:MAG: hypothetical protein M1484_02315 [Patescibacteria group bacterium]|nr:hypothetical protein [Patescibacteria group bacterium]